MELTASPPVFFAAEQIGLLIESHWLGSRWMYGRWEIADIAFFITLRQRGRLEARKLALLQTKRLYSKEIDVAELEDADYRIGIGRLADRIDPQVPLADVRHDQTASASFSAPSINSVIADERISILMPSSRRFAAEVLASSGNNLLDCPSTANAAAFSAAIVMR
ncbi:MAG: hypothetical protein B7Z20_13230 [Sphingobium sp. 32-64-5]|nr:MAG: hypothetical protein B7Z20_13230 [Sphingobium sp. 32-64-5]